MRTNEQEALEELVYSMLTESTGVHMLDSGGEEGRHWQRNAKRSIDDFRSDPEAESDGDSRVSVSTFHYLTKAAGLEIDDVCAAFNATCVPCPDWEADLDAYGVSRDGGAFVKAHGLTAGSTFNTYNGEWNGDQTLQGTYLEGRDGRRYVLLQVHNGCDVRGGYTDARLFRLADYCLMPPDVCGTVNGVEVSTRDNGYSLRDGDGNEVEIGEGDDVSLSLEGA